MSNIENNERDLNTLKDRREVDTLLECLLFLAKYHKRETSAESLKFNLPIHNRSFDVPMFTKASKRIGLTTKAVKRESVEKLTKLALPAVLLLEKDRSCVLLDYDEKTSVAKVILPGVSSGETEIPLSKLNSEFIGEVIIIKPEFNFSNRLDKEILVETPKEWFWGTLFRNKVIYNQVILVSLFINIFILATPLFTMNVYDRVLPNNAVETLWVLFIGISLVMIFDFILKILRSYFLGIASKRTDTIISNKIFNHVLNIKLDSKPASTGQFVSRLQSFESVREFFTSATVAAFVDFPFALIFLLVIFYISGPLVLVTIVVIIISIFTSWYMQKPLKTIIEKSVKEEQIKQTTLIETVTGLEIIKSVKAQNRMRTNWDHSVGKTVHYADKGQFLSQSIMFFTAFIAQFSNIAIVAGGVHLASNGDITMGAIIAAMMLNGRAISPVSHLVSLIMKYDKTMLSLNNLDEIMKMPVEKENKNYISRPDLNGDIEFKNVDFSYKQSKHQILRNLNLTIKRGEKVAILGKIGSGKSTILKLIMNLYEPNNGSILVGGVDVRQIDPIDLRNALGMVPQEAFLFMGSIKDNITIGEQYVSDEELIQVSKIAGLDEILSKHEAGFDLLVGERGEGLSGGEKQSITLARALISDPNILMLDEPTNSMDSQTEKAFIEKLKRIIFDKTVIIVTHKTSILDLVDRVLVIDNGNIVYDGSKEGLYNLNKGGKNEQK